MINLPISLPTQRYYRIGVSTFFFIQGLTFASWTSRIPDIKNRLHLSDGAFGGVLFSLPAGQLTAMALSGYLVSKYGSKLMLQIAALLFPAILLILGSVESTWQLIAGLFVFGICGNLSNIAVNTQGVGVERLYGRSIMASFHGLWSLAGFTRWSYQFPDRRFCSTPDTFYNYLRNYLSSPFICTQYCLTTGYRKNFRRKRQVVCKTRPIYHYTRAYCVCLYDL